MIFPSLPFGRMNSRPSAKAEANARSISSGDESVSTTSSRGIDWIPILTSTAFLSVSVLGATGHRAAGAGAVVFGTAVLTGPRPAADPPPRQPRDQLLGGVLGDHLVRAEPERGADLGHADQAHAEQARLVVTDPRVLPDDLADDLGTVTRRPVQPVADGGLVAEVGLEDQPEGLAGAPHEIEERGEGGGHALLVVGRGGQGVADGGRQRVDA